MTGSTEHAAVAERQADPHFELRFMDDETVEYELQLDDFQLALYPDESRISIGLSGNDLAAVRVLATVQHRIIAGADARITRLQQERDTALRDAEALREGVGRLRALLIRASDKLVHYATDYPQSDTLSIIKEKEE